MTTLHQHEEVFSFLLPVADVACTKCRVSILWQLTNKANIFWLFLLLFRFYVLICRPLWKAQNLFDLLHNLFIFLFFFLFFIFLFFVLFFFFFLFFGLFRLRNKFVILQTSFAFWSIVGEKGINRFNFNMCVNQLVNFKGLEAKFVNEKLYKFLSCIDNNILDLLLQLLKSC